MKTKYQKLILTGSISIDRIMNFKGRYQDMIQADKLHVLSLSVLIDQLTNSRGGTAANIAYSSALLGEKPILLGSVGHDAQEYVSDLSKLGIDTSHVFYSDLPTPTFTVMTDSQDNQIGGFYPGAMADVSTLSLKPWYQTKALVVISANDPAAMEQLVSECIANRLDYVYDVGQQVTNISVAQMKLGLSRAAILFVNDYELGTILSRTGFSETQLREMIPIIVTTLGVKGTRITGSSVPKTISIPAIPDVTVVDPTGAGDCYRAGFLYNYLRGRDLPTCARLGSVIATYTIEKHGTQTHTFTLDEIREKYYSTQGEQL